VAGGWLHNTDTVHNTAQHCKHCTALHYTVSVTGGGPGWQAAGCTTLHNTGSVTALHYCPSKCTGVGTGWMDGL
jgi:hypothetical protein